MSNDAPRTVQPLSGYLMTGFVLLTMLVAVRSFFTSETVLFRELAALWLSAAR